MSASMDVETALSKHKCRVTRYFVLTSAVLGAGFGLFMAAHGALLNLLGIIVFLVASGAAYMAVLRNKSALAARIQIVAVVLVHAWCVVFTGGIVSPVLMWSLIPILMAGFIINWRWSALLGVGYIGYIGVLAAFVDDFRSFSEIRIQSEAFYQIELASVVSTLVLAVVYSNSVVRALGRLLDASSNRESTDYLTGLRNRRYFVGRANEEISRCERYQQDLSVILIDIDHFKAINDQFGHPVGDIVLEQFGTLLTVIMRTSDVPARIGGEEFGILLPQTSIDMAESVAERLCRAVRQLEFRAPNGEIFHITVSVGVSTQTLGESITFETLFHQADQALYAAKSASRDCVKCFSDRTGTGISGRDEMIPFSG